MILTQATGRGECKEEKAVPNDAIQKDRYAWVIAAMGTFVVMGAIGFARFGYTLILPKMLTDLNLTDVQTGYIATSNLLGYLIFSLVCGLIATRYGPKIVIVLSLIVTAAGLFCTGLSNSYAAAAFWRFIAGSGGGGANVPMMGLISAWFSSKNRGLASGIITSGSSFALLISGLVLPPLMASGRTIPLLANSGLGNGWRIGWYLLGVITLLIAAAAGLVLRNRAALPSPKEAISSSIKTRPTRILSFGILRSKNFWILASLYAIFGFSYVIFATFFARYLTGEAALSERTAGSLWSGIGAVSIISGFLWGAASDRFGRKIALICIFTLQASAYLIFSVGQAMPAYIIASFLFALTAWSIPAVMGAAIGDIFGPQAAPALFGLITMIFGAGQALGPTIAGAVAEQAGSFSPAYKIAAAVALAGAIIATRLPAKAVSRR
jgi:MFS family permease